MLLYEVCKPQARVNIPRQTQSRGSADPPRRGSVDLGRPRHVGLHPTRDSTDPRRSGVQTPTTLVGSATQACGYDPSAQGMVAPMSVVCRMGLTILSYLNKIGTDHFLLNHPFNVKCFRRKRQPHPPAIFANFYSNCNFVIILVQFIVICV